MSVLLLQFDSRKQIPHPELISQNLEFSKQAGYEYSLLQECDESMPPYWAKIFACLSICESTARPDAILFVDTDAVVMDFDFRVDSLLPSGGEKFFAANGFDGGVNVGVFCLLCDDRGVAMLKRWCGLYSADNWSFLDGAWRSTGEWADETYEQGALNSYVLPDIRSGVLTPSEKAFLHCDHVSHYPKGTLITKDLLLEMYRNFASLMQDAQIAHFCGHFKSLIPIRHKLREGSVVLYDGAANDEEGAMKAAAKEWAARRR